MDVHSLHTALALTSCALLACAGDTFTPTPSGTAGTAGVGGSTNAGAAGAGLTGGSSAAGGGAAGAGGLGASSGASGASGAGVGGMAGTETGGASAAGTGGAAGGGGPGGAAGKGNAGNGGLGGKGGSGAAAGNGGSAGAAGGPNPACSELPPGPAVMGFAVCKGDFADCVHSTVAGTLPRLVATTCGVGAAFVPSEGDMTFAFPGTIGLPTLEYKNTTPPHSVAMLGPGLLMATGGDSLLVHTFGGGVPDAAFAPVSGGGPHDTLGYRSLFATKDFVAWTGRQGAAVAWQSPPDLGCTTDPAGGGCTGEIINEKPASGDPPPAWGVTAADKVLYWSHPLGVSRVDTVSPAVVTTYPIGSPNIPSSLATIAGRPLHAQGNTLTLLPAKFDGDPVEPPVPSPLQVDAEVRDLVLKDGVLYVLVARSASSAGSTTFGTISFGPGAALQVPRVLVAVPAAIDPVSLAVANDGLFFSARAGQIYRVKRLQE